MWLQLDHEGLAETHDLVVALALGIKVGAALAAAHGQAGEGVFEDLLKAQELDDRQVHAGVEAQAALGGADGGGELHPVAPIDLDLAPVIHPGHPEQQAALRLHQALNNAHLLQLGAALKHRLQRGQDLLHCLQKFLLIGVTSSQVLVYTVQICILDRHSDSSLNENRRRPTHLPARRRLVVCGSRL